MCLVAGGAGVLGVWGPGLHGQTRQQQSSQVKHSLQIKNLESIYLFFAHAILYFCYFLLLIKKVKYIRMNKEKFPQ